MELGTLQESHCVRKGPQRAPRAIVEMGRWEAVTGEGPWVSHRSCQSMIFHHSVVLGKENGPGSSFSHITTCANRLSVWAWGGMSSGVCVCVCGERGKSSNPGPGTRS